MNDRETRRCDMFGTVQTFGNYNASDFATESMPEVTQIEAIVYNNTRAIPTSSARGPAPATSSGRRRRHFQISAARRQNHNGH